MRTRKHNTRPIRNLTFLILGVLISFIVITIWSNVAAGASFQPIPDKVFGMQWGISLEAATKVRNMEMIDDLADRVKMYLDMSFNTNELPGVRGIVYMFLDGRLGGAFIKIGSNEDAAIFAQIFALLYGMPAAVDTVSGIIEWEGSGNIIQIDMLPLAIIMGNRIVIETMDRLKLDSPTTPAPNNENSDLSTKPKPKTAI